MVLHRTSLALINRIPGRLYDGARGFGYRRPMRVLGRTSLGQAKNRSQPHVGRNTGLLCVVGHRNLSRPVLVLAGMEHGLDTGDRSWRSPEWGPDRVDES